MPHLFEAQPIEVERFYTGVISQRNRLAIPIRVMGRRIIELYDAILSGGDAEISVRSTLVRRAGYTPALASNTFNGVPLKFYSFEPVASSSIIPIVDTTLGVFAVNNGVSSLVVAKGTPTNPGPQSSFFTVGNYLYIGNALLSQKYDGTSATNWGIAIGNVLAPVGPNTAANGVNGAGSRTWATPNNVSSSTNFATVTLPPGTTSAPLVATQFGFTVPATSTIVGISVSFGAAVTVGGPGIGINASLLKAGNIITTKTVSPNVGTATTISLGSPSDLWGSTWTANDVDQTNFGFSFTAFNLVSGPLSSFSLNNVRITVYTIGGPAVSLVAGSLTATQGYQYIEVYGNSADRNISNPTPPSATIKPTAQGVQVSLTASADPQVNQIRVFRTTDTGTGSVFLELPTSPYPNVTANIVDNAADNALVVSNSLTSPTLAFSPPPTGLRLMQWYGGRMWGAVGNLLYFAAGADNFPMGNGNSNWPPSNVFELPSTIVKLVPLTGGNGMLVVTLNKIHIVQGITNPGFKVNIWNPDIGARQESAVSSDGSNIYMFTSDRQALLISAAGIEELSQNISDTTDNWDPTLVRVCRHRSGSQDSRVFFSNGSTQIYPYNLMSSAWEPLQTPVDGGGVGAIDSIEVAPGIYKFLKGDTRSGQIVLQRDMNTFTDNGVQYTWGAIFGNIPVADPTQLANVDSITVRSGLGGVLPKLSILPSEIFATVNKPFTNLPNPVDEPPEDNRPPASYRAKKYYLSKGTAWTQMSHLQIQFQFGQSAQQEEIFSWGLFPNESADQQVQPAPQPQGR